MLMGNFTILYVIAGSIKVSLDGGKTSYLLEEQSTLICERRDGNAPTDVTMTPLLKPAIPGSAPFIQKGGIGLASSDLGNERHFKLDENDATVLLIQVHLSPEDKNKGKKENNLVISVPSPVIPVTHPSVSGMPPRPVRAGSVIVFDDQPMWNIPPSKLLMRRDSTDIELQSAPLSPTPNLQTKYFESAQHYR
jgi:hypothetical protein